MTEKTSAEWSSSEDVTHPIEESGCQHRPPSLRRPLQGELHCWEARMSTGVMHQIRLHAASIGLALAGDRLYGGGAWTFPRPDGAHFALHHIGISGPGLQPCEAPSPTGGPSHYHLNHERVP